MQKVASKIVLENEFSEDTKTEILQIVTKNLGWAEDASKRKDQFFWGRMF